MPLKRRDGSYFGTLCALDPLPATLTDDDFELFSLLAELIAYELEADELQQRREAELQAMHDLLAVAGHDLRQPLTVLATRAELLARKARRGAQLPDLAASLSTIESQARRAARLTQGLMDVARARMGNLAVEPAPLDLVALIRQSLDDQRQVAPCHTFLLEAPAACQVFGDEQRLGQVIRNLLDNAVKYAAAEAGPITVTLEEMQSGQQVLLRIRDHGPGVPDAELQHIFDRQYRTRAAVDSSTSGSGLGLFIAQQIIAAHAGRIWAENAGDGGLVVWVELPRNGNATPSGGQPPDDKPAG